MFGWVSEKMAKDEGFTHHASYYGVPIYWRNDDNAVWCKHPALDILFDVAGFFEGLIRPVMFPDEQPCFQFRMVKKIN